MVIGISHASFSDVNENHEYYDAITYVEDEGIVDGYADGTYLPSQSVNRAELTKIIVNSVYDEDTIEACELLLDFFPDFDHEEWFTKYVCVAFDEEIIEGYPDGTFQPANTIIFVEAAKIIVNGFGYKIEGSDVWYEPYVDVLEEYDAVPDAIGDDMEHKMTRGEIAEIIYRLLSEEEEMNTTSEFLTHIETVVVSPDDTYNYGAFCRVNYIEASDNFVVTFGGAQPSDEEEDEEDRAGGFEGAGGYAYKIYTTDFEYTDEHGIYIYGGGDAAVTMVDDVFYHLTGGGGGSWRLATFDTDTWEQLDEITIELEDDYEENSDQTIAFVNDQFIASSLYLADPEQEADPSRGEATHYTVLDQDLVELDHFILDDEPHGNGTSMLFIDNTYYILTSTAYWGDLIVMMYDEDWEYLGYKTLDEEAQWPQGSVYDEENERFYVSYISVEGRMSQTGTANNIKLGIFDKDWEPIEIIYVTAYTSEDLSDGGWRSIFMHEDKIYVSYDIGSYDTDTGEFNYDWQCWVDIYELK